MADPYAAFEDVEAPRDAKRSRDIVRRVEREADRQSKGAKPDVPQGGDADPYTGFEDVNTEPQGGAGRFAIKGLEPEPRNIAHYVVDAGKSFGSGLIKGGIGLATLPGTVEQLGRAGINYANRQFNGADAPDAVSPQPFLPPYQAGKDIVEQKLTGPLYTPKTKVGEYAGAVGEFAPGMLFPAAGAAGAAGGLASRLLPNVIGPAVFSETAGQLTKGTEAEPWARLAGGIAGGMAPQLAGRVISPNTIDPSRARMGQVLDNEGVQLTAGDRTGNRAVRWMESNAADVPFSGNRGQAIKEAQGEQFTRAVLSRAGIDAPRATPEVMEQAFQRIGGEFDAVGQALQGRHALVIDRNTHQQLRRIAHDYERTTEPALRNPLPLAIAEEISQLHNGMPQGALSPIITGEAYQTIRSQLGMAARGARDPRTSDALYQIQNVLDDAAEAALRAQSPDLAQRWQQARQQYRNMIAIERAATGAGENAALGLISPSALRNAVVQLHGRRNYARGDGDFADLARAGEALLKPLPNSGTGPRAVVSAVGAGVGAAMFGPAGGAVGALAPIAGQAALGRMTMNPLMQAYLANQAAAELRAMPVGSRAAILPNALAQYGDSQNALTRTPLQVTVYPNGDPRNNR